MVSSTLSGSEPGPYTTPFHVPATDLMSDTATGLIGPALAQPTSAAANPTTAVVMRMVQSHRAARGSIASPPVPNKSERCRDRCINEVNPSVVTVCVARLHEIRMHNGVLSTAYVVLTGCCLLSLASG